MDINDIMERLVIAVGAALLFFIARRILTRKKEKETTGKEYWFREAVMTLLVAYVVFLGGFTWFYQMKVINNPFYTARHKIVTGYGANLIPFKTIRYYFSYTSGELFVINIWGNIIMFLPWGIALPILWERYRNYFRMSLMSLAFSLIIEIGQLFVGRNVDIDDVIINAPSTFLAAVITILIIKRVEKKNEKTEAI